MKRSLAATAAFLLICIRAFAVEQTLLEQAIERIDRYVLTFAGDHKGDVTTLVGALVEHELKSPGLKLTTEEWKAVAQKIEEDMERLRRKTVEELPPSVYEFDLTAKRADMPIEWSAVPDELLLIFRGYDVDAVAGLGASLALPNYLSEPGAYARETIIWGFTSSGTFMSKIGGREALGSKRGGWIITTTFSRTPNGLIKPEIVRLHKRY
jgi:hypothetical protein